MHKKIENDFKNLELKGNWTETCTTKLYYFLLFHLKELEHRIGLKVLILKYDLGKSLSKEMWCKLADTKKILDYIFKRWKMHVIWGKSFLCLWTRKWFPLIMNGKLEMSWFVHIFLQNKHRVPIVYAVLRSYLDF